jgi:hypothetical protein
MRSSCTWSSLILTEFLKIAEALAEAGFPDVCLYVVVEARATGEDADLQLLHDRVKALSPMIEAAAGSGRRTHVTRA